jgi:hypothetical protein
MGETPDDIRYGLERARAHLGEDLNALEYSVRSELDWRRQFRRHTWPVLGVAFAVGVLLGLALSGGSRP